MYGPAECRSARESRSQRARLLSAESRGIPAGDDFGDVPVIGAAASAQQPDGRGDVLKVGGPAPERHRVALVELLGVIELGMAERRRVQRQTANALERRSVVQLGRDAPRVRTVIMKNSAAPPVARSTCAMAWATEVPSGSRPPVSTVNDATTGMPAAAAASTMPMACSGTKAMTSFPRAR
jgi:hypothetical protein